MHTTMNQHYTFSRTIPTDREYDLVVAGGGPAGCAAAICAARMNKRVLLVEASGALGGMGTNGLVANWYSLSDGERILTQGLFWEILEKAQEGGYLPPHVDIHSVEFKHCHGIGTGFNPEGVKCILDELCVRSGVEVRFGTRLIDADFTEGHINGVILHNVEGCRYVPAQTFVDATGDAVLSDLCQVPCLVAGIDTEQIMAPTLCAVVANVDWSQFDSITQRAIIADGIKDGFFTQDDHHVPGLFQTGDTYGIQNAGHLFGMNALQCKSLSDGYMLGRKLATEYTDFYRRYLKGCERIQLLATASLMGVRESRRVVGDYQLCYEDFQQRKHFSDQVGVYNKAIDIHPYNTSQEELERHLEEFERKDKPAPGESYGLPYRIMVNRDYDNLWFAGRCVSSDTKVNGALRDQPACYMLGEAAGVAAALCLETGSNAATLDTDLLTGKLREQGAYIP